MNDRSSLPDFELPATGNQRSPLSAFNGQPLVPYFLRPDDAPFELLPDPDETAHALFAAMKIDDPFFHHPAAH
jgi:hypothetical protein